MERTYRIRPCTIIDSPTSLAGHHQHSLERRAAAIGYDCYGVPLALARRPERHLTAHRHVATFVDLMPRTIEVVFMTVGRWLAAARTPRQGREGSERERGWGGDCSEALLRTISPHHLAGCRRDEHAGTRRILPSRNILLFARGTGH
jgi:hypothetical protein